MVVTALQDTDEAMRQAQYEVLAKWQEMYGKGLRIILPDTYGSEQFFAHAPKWLTDWKGQRQDSGDPVVEVNRYLDWLKGYGIQPSDRISIPSDGLDVPAMVGISSQFNGVHPTPFGYGTGLTNDFASTLPGNNDMRPFSMVIKPFSANGRPCVKLSNDVSKATGPRAEIERYIKIFGAQQRVERPVLV
jgi:nicotinate phosphoribosyltransferase